MSPFDRPCTTSYQSATVGIYILYRFRDIWRWRISWPWNPG